MENTQPQLPQSLNSFAFKVYHELTKDGNIFFSPLSIGVLLSALLPGASGKVRKELSDLLCIDFATEELRFQASKLLSGLSNRDINQSNSWKPDDAKNNRFIFHLADALFIRKNYLIKGTYREIITRDFLTDILSFDTEYPNESAKNLNKWVTEKTNGLIENVINPKDFYEDMALILLNAVYFKGEWKNPFEKELTRPALFYLLNEESRKNRLSHFSFRGSKSQKSVHFQMMSQNLDLKYYQNSRQKYEAVSLPYKGGMSMIIILPQHEHFTKFSQKLHSNVLNDFFNNSEIQEAVLGLPKFSMSSNFTLINELNRMGLSEAMHLTNEGFSGISDDPRGLKLSQLIHHARMNLDEEGTVAVAVTRSDMPAFMRTPKRISFIVNRPFIFFIYDEVTETILFMGRVLDPSI